MTEPLAIVLAGLGGAVVSGLVAVASSAISLRAARHQTESQMKEHELDRRHQIVVAILQRRHQALEEIWQLLFVVEREGHLTAHDTISYVKNLMWLPSDIQGPCVAALGNPDARRPAVLAGLRQSLMDEVKSLEFR